MENHRKGSYAKKNLVADNSTEDKHNSQPRRILRNKKARCVERDHAALKGDYCPPYHRKSISKQANCSESDAVSDDSLDDDDHMQQSRNVKVEKAKFMDNDVVSNDTMDYDSDCLQREEHSSKQVEDMERDANSEDFLDVGSLQLQRKISRAMHVKSIREEDIISDDQMESPFQKS